MTNKEQLHHQFLVEDSIGMLTNAELQDFMSEVQSIMSDPATEMPFFDTELQE